MSARKKNEIVSQTSLFILAILVLCSALVFGYFKYQELQTYNTKLSQKLEQTETQLDERTIEKEGLEERVESQGESVELLANELQKLTGTVNILEKLQNTDEELLQKYSKVYFLNEHYVPPRLREIPENFVDSKDPEELIHTEVWPQLRSLLEEAEDENIPLRVVSAYRSFSEQSKLKTGYTVVYGSGANAFSADQGYSEHQLGTTIDFSTAERNRVLDGFENTEAYKWLQKNAYKFGFVLSYPHGNSYYVFEPWHWRYVGKKLAQDLNKNDAYFYDWDQRKIDEYLVSFFD